MVVPVLAIPALRGQEEEWLFLAAGQTNRDTMRSGRFNGEPSLQKCGKELPTNTLNGLLYPPHVYYESMQSHMSLQHTHHKQRILYMLSKLKVYIVKVKEFPKQCHMYLLKIDGNTF